MCDAVSLWVSFARFLAHSLRSVNHLCGSICHTQRGKLYAANVCCYTPFTSNMQTDIGAIPSILSSNTKIPDIVCESNLPDRGFVSLTDLRPLPDCDCEMRHFRDFKLHCKASNKIPYIFAFDGFHLD